VIPPHQVALLAQIPTGNLGGEVLESEFDTGKHVTWVVFRAMPINNDALSHLKALSHLTSLCIDESNVTDAGLDHLKDMTQLEVLDIWDTNITDAGLSRLVHLTNLKGLTLHNTLITDDGLEPLKTMTSLRVLGLSGSGITRKGIERLQTALPGTVIVSGSGSDLNSEAPIAKKGSFILQLGIGLLGVSAFVLCVWLRRRRRKPNLT
jgi:Leucine-rich repeat (LRR) protein